MQTFLSSLSEPIPYVPRKYDSQGNLRSKYISAVIIMLWKPSLQPPTPQLIQQPVQMQFLSNVTLRVFFQSQTPAIG